MSTLNRNLIQVKPVEAEVVPVPEFGTADDGSEYTVNVRPLTVQSQGIFTRYLLQHPNSDPSAVLAAIHAVDDDGNLVFGETVEDAVEMLSTLPSEYRTAVMRMSSTALGDFIKSGNEAVDAAEKN